MGLKFKLLWHHESRVVVLEESLLVDPRVQIGNALVHPVDADLLRLLKALLSIDRNHQSVSNGRVEAEIHALEKQKEKSVIGHNFLKIVLECYVFICYTCYIHSKVDIRLKEMLDYM